MTELVRSRDRAERETVGQLRMALRELRQEEEELQPERKKLLPPGWKRFRAAEIKELAMARNIPICGPNGMPQVKDSRPAALVRERETATGTAPFAARAPDVPVDATVGSAQSRVNSLRRRLAPTEEDIFIRRVEDVEDNFGSFCDPRGEDRPTKSCLERGHQEGEVETIDTELKDKIPREQPRGIWTKATVGERCPPIFDKGGFAIGRHTWRVMEAGVESSILGT